MKIINYNKLIHSLLMAFFFMSTSALAEIVIVVHPSNTSNLDQRSISRIFLGKEKKFPNGAVAIPINQLASNAASSEFNSKVLKKSARQLKAYWSKLLFTGKGTPPKNMDTSAEVILLVSSNPNLIGYIQGSEVTDSIRVVGKF